VQNVQCSSRAVSISLISLVVQYYLQEHDRWKLKLGIRIEIHLAWVALIPYLAAIDAPSTALRLAAKPT